MGAGQPAYALANNEHPLPPPAQVRVGLQDAARELNRYPEFRPERMTELIAQWQGMPPELVAVGHGAGGVAHDLFRAAVVPSDRVAFSEPGFELYPMLCQMTGAAAVPVPLDPAGRHDLAALTARATAGIRMLVLCNPHNPTGTTVPWSELAAFLDGLPPHVLVVLDEAYIDFAADHRFPDPAARLLGRPNLVILRTMSKSHGLAALRIGFAFAFPEIVRRIRGQQVPFAMNQLQYAGAAAAIAADDEMRRRIAVIADERERVRGELERIGWPVSDSQANFLWIVGPARLDEARDALAKAGVAVRHHPGHGIRVSIGEREAGDAVIAALARVGGSADASVPLSARPLGHCSSA
jgi:histidinol-phosphate aminotransferase